MHSSSAAIDRSGARYLLAGILMLGLGAFSQAPLMDGPRALLRGGLVPLEAIALPIERAAGSPGRYLGDTGRLNEDNARLKDENKRLQAEVAGLQGAGHENDELRRALDFQRSYGHQLLAAQVVGRGPDAFSRTLTIDRGTAEGVHAGLVVVTGYGLVGRVREAGPHAATIQTVADPAVRVNAYTVRSGLEGTVSGGPGALRMEVQAKADATATPGEWVLTSGVGGGYPRGLVIGQVIRFDRHASALTELADLAWANDLSAIGLVMVIQDFTPQ